MLVTFLCARQTEGRAAIAYPPEGSMVPTRLGRIHAVVAGSGPDVVLIHGLSGSTRDFTHALMPALASRYRVIALDRPGLGWSDPVAGGAAMRVQAACLREAAAALGAHRPIVLGQSYGGAVALAWAVDAPQSVRALVAVAAASHPSRTGLPALYLLPALPVVGPVIRLLAAAWVPDALIAREARMAFAPQPVPQGYLQHFGPRLSLRRFSQRENARQLAGARRDLTALAARYPALDVPVEQVHGDADLILPLCAHAGPLAQALPDTRLVTLHGIGHMPHHVAVPEVVAAVDRAARRSAGPQHEIARDGASRDSE